MLRSGSIMHLTEAKSASVQVVLQPSSYSGSLRMPLVQGMAFVTAIYQDLTPRFFSGVGFQSCTTTKSSRTNIFKCRIVLSDWSTWLLYVASPAQAAVQLQIINRHEIQMDCGQPFCGTIQVTKCPSPGSEYVFDTCAGAWATDIVVSGSLDDFTGGYSFAFRREASNTHIPLLMYALPHHLAAFDQATALGVHASCQLMSTTKGAMTAVIGDSWRFEELEVPTHLVRAFTSRNHPDISDGHRQQILDAAAEEVKEDFDAVSNREKLYLTGKSLDRYAQLCYTLWRYESSDDVVLSCLAKLKHAWKRFASNKLHFPLVYDSLSCSLLSLYPTNINRTFSDWKGIVSSGAFVTGDEDEDNGHSYYGVSVFGRPPLSFNCRSHRRSPFISILRTLTL